MTIVPFSIATSDDVLEDLRRRLEMTRPDAETRRWCKEFRWLYAAVHDYWLKNILPSRSGAQSLACFHHADRWVGYSLHIRSPREDAKPLLMTHGWPGSVVEFQNVIAR